MNKRIGRYVALVCVAAIGAGIALYLREPYFSVAFANAAITFGLISVMAQLLSYRTGRSSTGSVSFIPVLASAAIAPHWVSVLAVIASSLTGQIVAKRNRLRTIFNPAQEALSLALAILAYRAFGGAPLHSIGESGSLSLFALFLVFFLTNSVCVSGALGIVGERSAWVIWKENTLSALPYDFLSLPAILFFVWTYTQYGTVGAFVFAVPLWVCVSSIKLRVS